MYFGKTTGQFVEDARLPYPCGYQGWVTRAVHFMISSVPFVGVGTTKVGVLS